MNPTTGSVVTRRVGVAAIAMTGFALAWALRFSHPEVEQKEAVRLMYLHLPTIAVAYLGFAVTLVASIMYLRGVYQQGQGSIFWDLTAEAAAEIGVVFTAFLLFTGALWGKPTWGVYWQWDPRLTSTTVMFIMYLGYLALRRLDMNPEVRSRRAAVLGIISFLNVIIVHYSVQWWRGLHQGQTLGIDTKLDGTMLFSLFVSTVAFLLIGAWLLIHRFRVAYLEHQVGRLSFEQALAERRDELGGTILGEAT